MIDRILSFLGVRQNIASKGFFDYSAREKKKIVFAAVRESAKMQNDLLKRYEMRFSSK